MEENKTLTFDLIFERDPSGISSLQVIWTLFDNKTSICSIATGFATVACLSCTKATVLWTFTLKIKDLDELWRIDYTQGLVISL